MSFINYAANEMTYKIVYCGTTGSGKTSNLQWINHKLESKKSSDLVQLPFDIKQALFFDFMAINLNTVKGVNIKLHIYSLPAEPNLTQNRKSILQGTDAIVFIADSNIEKKQSNIEALTEIKNLLKSLGYNLKKMPFIFQYNKRDLKNTQDINDMRLNLNTNQNLDFQAQAINGEGVLKSFKAAYQLLLAQAQSAR